MNLIKKNQFRLSIAYLLLVLAFLLENRYTSNSSAPYLIALPVLFAAIVLLRYKRLKEYLIVLALFLSGLGDLFGALSHFFMQIIFFSMAHIFYILAFSQMVQFSYKGMACSILIIGFALCYTIFITAKIPANEQYTSIIYSLIVSVMCASSFLYNGQYSTLFRIAAVLFLISDGMIAWSVYSGSFPFISLTIMTSYYLAQYLFLYGFLVRDNKVSKPLTVV